MEFVKKRSDVISNLETFESYLSSKKKAEKEYALEAIKNAELILIYKVNGENHFGPCDFMAFKKNDIKKAPANSEVENKDITNAMTKVVGRPFANESTDKKFQEFWKTVSKAKSKVDRTYWRIKDERGKNFDLKFD